MEDAFYLEVLVHLSVLDLPGCLELLHIEGMLDKIVVTLF